MEKIKEYKGIIIIILILISIAFYWYSIRPTSIRKECGKSFSYEDCLHSYGLSN